MDISTGASLSDQLSLMVRRGYYYNQQWGEFAILRMLKSLHGRMRLMAGRFSTTPDPDFEKAEKYVLETLRARSWVDYMIMSYLPKEIRTPYAAIQLFNLETIKISDNIKEPSLGLGRLEFWRETIRKIYRSEKPNPEPISICLSRACSTNPLTKGYFERIINARSQQLSCRQIDSMEQMLKLSQNVYSTLFALNLELLRMDVEKEHEELLTKMGHSMGIVSYLRRVPYGLRNYRFLVPTDIMSKYNVTADKIWDRVYGRASDDFFDAVLEIAAFSKKSFQESALIYEELRKQNKIHPEAFRAFLRGVQVQYYLQRLQKYNFNLFEPAMNKGSVTLPLNFWKAARNKKFYVTGKIQ